MQQNSVLSVERSLKVEPLATVASLEQHLLKMVAKQWYDFDRSTFSFIKRLKTKGSTVSLRHESSFDENGLIYWLGTNGRSVSPPPTHDLYLTAIDS